LTDIAKGILSGGWSLIFGWILPAAINIIIFGIFVLPSLRDLPVIGPLGSANASTQALVVLVAAVISGLVFSALQTPLYRVLEGYLMWPGIIAGKRREHYKNIMRLTQDRLDAIYYRSIDAPSPEQTRQLTKLEQDSEVSSFLDRHKNLPAAQRYLYAKRLRYPVDANQVAPTRLGNAIRRFEEYGYDRYRLDSQALWYELTSVVPKPLVTQIENARAGVDFFVSLLYGNLLIAALSLVSLSAEASHPLTLGLTSATLAALAFIWYQLAWATTDDWALAVRALVDLGRKPLADSVCLALPRELNREREMWEQYCLAVLWPYDVDRSQGLDEFRSTLLAAQPAGDSGDGSNFDPEEEDEERG
jgi:hypothetical protein